MRCYICGAPAKARCSRCGQPFCEKHISGGVCVLCREALCMRCGERFAVATCPYCGRIICENCSKQLNPVVRICLDCWDRIYGRGRASTPQ